MSNRLTIGNRTHTAALQRFVGADDVLGTPAYWDDGNWETVTPGWFCEILSTTGNERLRGRQVSAFTTHVFYGDYASVADAGPQMRLVSAGVTYQIVAAFEPSGLNREMRIEARRDGL